MFLTEKPLLFQVQHIGSCLSIMKWYWNTVERAWALLRRVPNSSHELLTYCVTLIKFIQVKYIRNTKFLELFDNEMRLEVLNNCEYLNLSSFDLTSFLLDEVKSSILDLLGMLLATL